MALKIIVSYDDTDNDRDALALGRLLAISGAELSLAYVRHSFGESLEQKEAEELLARGAASVGTPEMPKHVVVNPGTSVGLTELAEQEGADVIVFGSEYRTAQGLVKPGISAHKLLLGGPAAIAVAPAGLREHPVGQRQHRRRHRRGRRGRPRHRGQPRRLPSAPPWSSTAAAGSTSWSSARGLSPRRARSCSAPPATTRSRPRTTRSWSCRAASRSASGRAAGSGAGRFRVDDDHRRDLRVAAVDCRSRGGRSIGRPRSPAAIAATAASSESASTTTASGGRRGAALGLLQDLAGHVLAPSARRWTSPAEGEVGRLQLRALEDLQVALFAVSTRGRRARSCPRPARAPRP